MKSLRIPRSWSAALAAIGGSGLVGVMPLAALHLYADGLSAPSMLFWRYAIAILALGTAATLAGLKLSQAWRHGAWRVVLLGATFGAGQTLCFWESIKTLETSIAVLLFYTYPAVTLAIDRLVVPAEGASAGAALRRCDPVRRRADHRARAASRRARSARSRLGHTGAAALRGVSRGQHAAVASASGADRRDRAVPRTWP